MKTAEEILKETLNLKGEITEKDNWKTVSVKDCLKAINKALAISRVSKSFCECSFVMIRRNQKTQKAYCFECEKEVQE